MDAPLFAPSSLPMHLSLLSLLVLATGVLAGCAATRPGGSPPAIVGTTWTLSQSGADRPTGSAASLTFGTDGRFTGTTGCNTVFGMYTLGLDGALTLPQVGSTRMACAGPDMDQERRVLDALNHANRATVDNGQLVLSAGSTRLLTFDAPRGGSQTATISGTMTYRERISLPPNAVATVRLLDASGTAIVQTTVETDGRQVPIPFSLGYDASGLMAGSGYAVTADIRDADGALLWTTGLAAPVITNGAPTTGVQIQLMQATGASGNASGALVGTTWSLSEIQAASGVTLTLDGNAPYSVTFGTDSRYNGRADCNQIAGDFTSDTVGMLRLSAGLSTLAACPAPSVADYFLGVFNTVDRYDIVGNRLMLSGSGGTLVFGR